MKLNIRDIRLKANMTQKEFAEYFNIPQRTIENWEGVKRTPPEYVVELIKYKIEKERLGMLKLKEIQEGGEIGKTFEGTLEAVLEWLKNNYSIFDFIWEAAADEHNISVTTPYEDLEGEQLKIFKEKMPQLEGVETLKDLEAELEKVNLSLWSLEVEELQ